MTSIVVRDLRGVAFDDVGRALSGPPNFLGVDQVRILLHEFASGGGFAGREVPASLGREGSAMLNALVADLAATGCHEIVTTVDPRFPLAVPPGVRVVTLAGNGTARHRLSYRSRRCRLAGGARDGSVSRTPGAQSGTEGKDAPRSRLRGDPPGVGQSRAPPPSRPTRRRPSEDHGPFEATRIGERLRAKSATPSSSSRRAERAAMASISPAMGGSCRTP